MLDLISEQYSLQRRFEKLFQALFFYDNLPENLEETVLDANRLYREIRGLDYAIRNAPDNPYPVNPPANYLIPDWETCTDQPDDWRTYATDIVRQRWSKTDGHHNAIIAEMLQKVAERVGIQ